MILVLVDPVFSFCVSLCCVLGKVFLALSELFGDPKMLTHGDDLWDYQGVHSVDTPPKIWWTHQFHCTVRGEADGNEE